MNEAEIKLLVEQYSFKQPQAVPLHEHFKNFGYEEVAIENRQGTKQLMESIQVQMWNDIEEKKRPGFVTIERAYERMSTQFPDIVPLQTKSGERAYDMIFGDMHVVVDAVEIAFAQPYPPKGFRIRQIFLKSQMSDRYLHLEDCMIEEEATTIISFCFGISAVIRRRDTHERFIVLIPTADEEGDSNQWSRDDLIYSWLHEHAHLVVEHEDIVEQERLVGVMCIALIERVQHFFPEEKFFNRDHIIEIMEKSLDSYRRNNP